MKNRYVIFLTLIINLIIVGGGVVYNIYTTHQNEAEIVVQKEFSYEAKKCYNMGVCPNKIVYLSDLYQNKFIEDKLINPQNKKYYAEDSFIDLEKNEITLKS